MQDKFVGQAVSLTKTGGSPAGWLVKNGAIKAHLSTRHA